MDDLSLFNGFAGPDEEASAPAPAPAPGDATQQAGPPQANPFDGYADNSLQPAPPTPTESFVENFGQAFGGTLRAGRAAIDVNTINRAKELGTQPARPTISPRNLAAQIEPDANAPDFAKPVQSDVDAAVADIAKFQADRKAYENFHSEGIAGKAAAVLGGAAGAIFSPENLALPIFGPVGGLAELGAAKIGLGEIASRIAARSAEFGSFSAASDAATQGLDMKAGVQAGFDQRRLLLSTALGMGFGATMEGALGLIRALKGQAPEQAQQATEGLAAGPVEPAAGVAPEAPGAPVDPFLQPIPEAPARSPAPSRPSPSVPAPESLVGFLKRHGGIKDDGGELAARDLSRQFPGLVNRRGMSLDAAREAAAEAGYLGGDTSHAVSETTVNDFLDALDNHPVYSVHDERQAADYQTGLVSRNYGDRLAAYVEQLRNHVEDQGGNADDPELLHEAAAVLLHGDIADPDHALERASITLLERDSMQAAGHRDEPFPAEIFDGLTEDERHFVESETGRQFGEGDRQGQGPAGEGDAGAAPQALRASGKTSLQVGTSEPGPGRAGSEQPLLDQPLIGKQPVGPVAAARRRSNRVQMPGEDSKPLTLPPDATDGEIRSFKLTQTMQDIARRLGRRLEQDSRGKRGTLGTYKPKEGVLRIRYAGDVDVFSHELGHAIDQRMATNPATKAEWANLQKTQASELLPLDFNAARAGGPPKIEEGVAEFLRMYITNPAYAAKQAPFTYAVFQKSILSHDPELAGILADAARMAQIESGLSAPQVMESMIANPPMTLFGRARAKMRRDGFVPSVQDFATNIYGKLIGRDIHFARMTQALRDAAFEKTGKPAPLEFKNDPYVQFRRLPGAEQATIGSIRDGVRPYGDPFGAPASPSLEGAIKKALSGAVSRLENADDPLVSAFNAYLVSRRARALWARWEAGDLRNQPVRASKNEVLQAISDYETRFPQFQSAADDVFAFTRAHFNRMVDAGVVPRSLADAIQGRADDYVPFWRDFSNEKATDGGGGKTGNGLERSPYMALTGSTRDILNPLRAVIESAGIGERLIAKNDVWKALDDLAMKGEEFAAPFWEHVPNTEIKGSTVDIAEAIKNNVRIHGGSPMDADMAIRQLEGMIGDDLSASVYRAQATTSRGERVLFFWRGGERQAVKVGDTEIPKQFFDLMTAMSEPEKDVFVKVVGAINSGFQSAIVHAPRFLTNTLIRDNMTRIFIPRYMSMLGRVPMMQDVAGAYTMLFDREFYKAYARMGGIRGGTYSHAVSELHGGKDALHSVLTGHSALGRSLDQIRSGYPFKSVKGVATAFKGVATALPRLMSDTIRLIESSETVSRVGVAKLTFRYLQKQGLSKEDALYGALHESRDVLDYSRRGDSTRTVARLVPFLNAGLQGADRSLTRGLVGEPLAAAARAFQRGGWANLDGKDKAILHAAWKNWLAVGVAGGVTGSVYYNYVKDSDFYRNASQYMKDSYWLIPTGHDKDGKPTGLTLHKPYDFPNVFINAVENYAEAMRTYDPKAWHRVFGSIEEAVPRQFRSLNGVLEGSPPIKTAFELATGMKLGFDDAPPRPIVPDRLKALPPEMQQDAFSSWISKKMGSLFGVSPKIVDHVIDNMGGTLGQDVKDISSAVMDDNPLVSTQDAMSRFFYGQIYRTQRGSGSAGADLQSLVARDHGSYIRQANAYRQELQAGRLTTADAIYNHADDSAKTYMTLEASSHFDPADRQLQPIERSRVIGSVLYPMMRDLGKAEIEVKRTYRRGEPHKFIYLSGDEARAVQTQLSQMLTEETKNGLTMAGQPGYEGFRITDTAPRLDILREIRPEVAQELEKRLKAAHVLPAPGVAEVWPEARTRLLQDRDKARLRDLVARAKSTAPAYR